VKKRVWLLALTAWGALLAASAPAWPDDWDGIGFLESIRDFDLTRFHPHPPGYPVYVALLRVAAFFVRDPMRATVLVATASGVVTVALSADAARRRRGELAGISVGVLLGVTPLVWHACSGVGSEAPALACAAACAWGLAATGEGRRGSLVLGLGVGLGLGARLSWAPLYGAALLLAPRGARARAWGTSAVAGAAWAAPLLVVVGPAKLYAVTAAHFAGHAERWGGTIVTQPGPSRLTWLARDVLVDGLGMGLDPIGLAIGAVALVAAAQAVLAWRSTGWAGLPQCALVVLPYLAWIALGQNVREQPRHALPIVALLVAGLAWRVVRGRPFASASPFLTVAALALLFSVRTGLDAYARRTVPPPGEQLVELARRVPQPDRLAVFGTASVRFFEGTELAARAYAAGSLGDVQVRLGQMDRLPNRVWLTSEVQTKDQTRWPLDPVATLCRPPRLDRRLPCIDVIAWKPPYLPGD
jgi:hypothetical protein